MIDYRDEVNVTRHYFDGRDPVSARSGITDGGFGLSPEEQLAAAIRTLDHLEKKGAQHADPDVWKCPICGHFDPHIKNGGCGANVTIVRLGKPPYGLQCMCGTDLYLTPERIAGTEPLGKWWTTDE
jgi:hypothetical protein